MALEQVSTFVLPNEYQRQATEARRRRRMAEMLAQQAYQPSDISAPIPAAAPLVQGLQAFLAARAERKADEAEEAAKETASREARQYLKALTEEDTTTDATQPEGPTAPPTVTMPQFEGGRIMAPASIEMGAPPPMVAPQVQLSRYNLTPGQRRAAALEGMLSSQNPMIQNIGSTIYPTLQPEKTKLQIGPVNLSDLTPESAQRFAASLNPQDIVYAAQPAKAPTTVGGMMWDANRGRFVEIPGYSAQQGAIAAAKRPDVVVTGGVNEPLVSVKGPDGSPILVPRSQAAGMMPYSAKQEAIDVERVRSLADKSATTQTALDNIAELIVDPGRKAGTGASAFLGNIPGTAARSFQAKLETFKAQTFIPMVSALKGMGALSDAEGKKLSAAVGALEPNMKEQDFESELRKVAKTLYGKAKIAGLDIVMPEGLGDSTAAPSRSKW
jgi:hypothetical protein